MSRLTLQRNRSPARRTGIPPPPPPLPPSRRAPNRIPPVRQPSRYIRNRSPPVRQRVVPSGRVQTTSTRGVLPTTFRRGNASHHTNANTTYVNREFVPVNGLSNIPVNKRVYIHTDVNSSGSIKHVYHKDGLVGWIQSQGGSAPSPFTRRPVTYNDIRMLT
jgi:hypothetical protein